MPICKKFALEGGCSHTSNLKEAIVPVFDADEQDLEEQNNPVDESAVRSYTLFNSSPLLRASASPHLRHTSFISLPPHNKKSEKTELQKKWEALPQLIDSHLHLVNFVQEEGTGGIKGLVEQMKHANVEKAVLLGMGVCKKWQKDDPTEPTYYTDDDSKCYFYSHTDQIVLDAVTSLPTEDQKRFAPLISGINPTDLHAIKHVKRMYEKAPHLWRGVGELLLRHDDLTNLTIDQEPGRADHPALQKVFDFCTEKHLPVLIHHNCTNIAVSPDPTAEFRYIKEKSDCLERNPDLTVVWAHCGASRRVGNAKLNAQVEEMLAKFPNLHVDISWVVLEDEIMDPADRTKPKAEWVQLIEKFSDRVLVGSDVVSAYEKLKDTLFRYAFLVGALKDSTAQKIMRGNAERLFFPRDVPTNLETLTDRAISVTLSDGTPATFVWGRESLKVFSDEEFVIRKNCLSPQFKQFVALNYPILHGLDGEAHAEKKRIVNEAHTTPHAFHHVGVFASSIEPKIQQLTSQIAEQGGSVEVRLMRELNQMHINAVFPFVCSAVTTKEEYDNSLLLQQGFYASTAPCSPALPAARYFDSYWKSQIAARGSESKEDVLSLLKDGGISNVNDLIPELNVSAFAQIQNVAKGVGNTIVSVLTHKDIHDRLMSELLPHASEIAARFDYELLQKLPLLVRVVQETLRRYSLVARNQGIANKDFELHGVFIKKGSLVLASWFHTNQDTEVYTNPKTWNPDRFPSHSMEATDFWGDTYEWAPFGAGPREKTHKCPAMKTAFSLICFYVAKLLCTFHIEMVDPTRGVNETLPGASPFDDLPVRLSLLSAHV